MGVRMVGEVLGREVPSNRNIRFQKDTKQTHSHKTFECMSLVGLEGNEVYMRKNRADDLTLYRYYLSDLPPQAGIAQLAERMSDKHKAPGSRPGISTFPFSF